MAQQSTCSKVSVGIAITVGLIACVVGVYYYIKLPDIVKNKIEKSLPIKNGTDAFERFQRNSVPIYIKFYFFNITNPDEVTKHGKPNLAEVGPYIFRQEKIKDNIKEVTDDNRTLLKYEDRRVYHYVSGNLNDKIYHLNAFYILLADAVAEVLDFAFTATDRGKFDSLVNNGSLTLVEHHTIDELIFTGYESDLISSLKTFSGPLKWSIKRKYPKDNLFGFYKGRNDTFQNTFVVDPGIEDINALGEVVKMDNSKLMKMWKQDAYCQLINGSDATIYPPSVEKSQRLYAFLPEAARSINFIFEEEVTVEDIDAYKFVLSEEIFNMFLPENKCFCNDICEIGMFKLSPGTSDEKYKKVVFSLPHFYQAKESSLNYVSGLKPEKDKHETYIVVEPNTGGVIKAAKRLQLSVHLRNIPLPIMKDIQEPRVVPIAWFEEYGEITEPKAREFRAKVINPMNMGRILFIALMAVGGLIILVSALACVAKRRDYTLVPTSPLQLREMKHKV